MPPATDLGALLARLEEQGIRLGLERMAELLAALGSPERAVATVLVGGTNGKGSTSALLERSLRAAGLRTGLYISPHLEDPVERIRVDGACLSPDALGTLLDEICGKTPGLPTYFEAFTAAAFLAFARAGLDLAVVEVGMGGRLDATNLCAPELSLVSSIDFDHQEYLGSTLSAIAREKAGIFRPDRPALLLAGGAEATAALLDAATTRRAAALDLTPWLAASDVLASGWNGIEVRLATPAGTRDLHCSLAGRHQAGNLLLAVAAVEALRAGGRTIPEAAVVDGVSRCRWPGRLESVILPDGRRVLLDAAHNPGGVARLAEFLDERGERFTLLFAALRDKELARMLPPLAARAETVVLTAAASPRSATPEELARRLAVDRPARLEADRQRALDAALGQETDLLVICGSIYLIGEMRRSLRQRFGVPPAARESE